MTLHFPQETETFNHGGGEKVCQGLLFPDIVKIQLQDFITPSIFFQFLHMRSQNLS